ncbi:MAG: hypothetical protein ABGX05_00815, partial [Pirellulaceae bacterium]
MAKLFSDLRWSCLLLLAVSLLVSIGCGKGKEGSESSKDATTVPYMHPDFRVAIVIRPQQLLTSELVATVTKSLPGDPVNEMVKEMTENTGLDPHKIDRIVLLGNSFVAAGLLGGGATRHLSEEAPTVEFIESAPGEDTGEGESGEDAGDPGECEFQPAASEGTIELRDDEMFPAQKLFICGIIDLVKGVDATALAKEFTGSDQTVKHGEHAYYSQTDGGGKPSVCVISDSTILVAEEDHLKKILATGNAQSPLADELKTIDNTNDLSLVILLGDVVQDMGIEDTLNEISSMPDLGVPPQVSANAALAKDISAFTISVNLKSDTPLQVVLSTSNGEVAGKLSGSLEEFKKMGREAIEEWDGEGNPIAEAANKAINGLTITNEDSRVGVALKMAPADLQAAVESIAPLLGLFGMGGGSDTKFSEEDFPIPEEGSNDPVSDPDGDTDFDPELLDLPGDVTKEKDG